jgi:hypothetical protein
VIVTEVEADDCESAELLALAKAGNAKAADWRLLPFDKSAYRAHVERCTPTSDIAHAVQDGESEASALAEARSLEPDEDTRYALLHANVNSGEGEVILQPWFTDHEPDLMEHDLCRDWIEALQQHADEGLVGFERTTASDGDTEGD